MIRPAAPDTFSTGLQKLRRQLSSAFTGQRPAPVPDPVAFSVIDTSGRNAKDDLARYTSRP